MEESIKEENSTAAQNEEGSSATMNKGSIITTNKKKQLPEVSVIRNWKEYLGESLLIVFSVILALGLTEVINKINEDNRTKEVLHQLREEIVANKNAEEEQLVYHRQVLKNIDSALRNPQYAQQFISNGELDQKPIFPDGVIKNDLNDVAWQIAKQNNIFSKIDLSTYSLLTDIYDNQQRITNSELEIGHLLLSFESRKPENLKTTLILLSDNYHGWAVDRAPRLLQQYQKAIDRLAKY
jgi:hypothetical protein